MTVKPADRAKIAATAEKYVKAGKLVAAIVEYEKLLDGTSQDIPISNIIGDLHLRHGDDDKAIRIFGANIKALERQGAFAQALAIAKKIQKVRPHDFENTIRMGDLYSSLGFVAEARAEYLRAAEELERRRERSALLALYEKLARIDRTDLTVRLKLARLYLKKSLTDKAVAEMNEVAELLFVRNEFLDAEKILRESLSIREDNIRSMSNLVRVLVAGGKRGEAIAQIETDISRHGERAELLELLANLHFEAGDDERAAELYGRILDENPMHGEARAKLGRIEIRRGRLDEAYGFFEPLVLGFLRKNKEDKAVGLLGLILMTGTMHLPTLEKLATVFRVGGRRPELEVVDRILLSEYRAARRDDDRARVVKELIELSPFDAEVEREFKSLHWEARVFAGDKSAAAASPARPEPESASASVLSDEERDVIRLNLDKADQYLAQGLVRNARRVVDNLLLLYPESPAVRAKLEELQGGASPAGPDALDVLIGQIAAEVGGAGEERAPSSVEYGALEEGKVTAADLFSGLDIVPFVPRGGGAAASEYLDLEEQITEELEAIEAAYYKQVKDRTVLIEKDLADIVHEFRREVDTKLAQANLETRYSLGQAFLEQGLSDEAIEEFKIAAADPEREADCGSLIARAFIQKKNYPEAERWLSQALEKTPRGSNAHFALTYEMAALCESMNRNERALALFREVLGWNPKFRDAGKRSRILEKIVSAG